MAFLHGPAQRVSEGGLRELEESQRVAHEQPILRIGEHIGVRRAGRGRETQLDAVEVPQHATVLAVDRAMALVGDDEIEITGDRSEYSAIMVCKVATVMSLARSNRLPGRSTWQG